jgi:hypothetical protein
MQFDVDFFHESKHINYRSLNNVES